MVQHAYTAARGNAVGDDAFGWARNITRKTHSKEVLMQHVHDLTSWQALWWSIMMRLAPPDMVNELRREMEGLPRSNWNLKEKDTSANISILVDGHEYAFSRKHVELGPPCGVTAVDYAKYASYVCRLMCIANCYPQVYPPRKRWMGILDYNEAAWRSQPGRQFLLCKVRYPGGKRNEYHDHPSLFRLSWHDSPQP